VEIRRMAILAECDICGNQHRVKDGLVGASIRCKDCGVVIVVAPGPSISPETYFEEGGRFRLRERVAHPSKFWIKLSAVLIACLMFGALVCAVYLLSVLVRPVSNQAQQIGSVTRGCGDASVPIDSPLIQCREGAVISR
jgi:hypothetical protein